MNESTDKLLDIFGTGRVMISLAEVRIQLKMDTGDESVVTQLIDRALDTWRVEKILADDQDGEQIWFLRLLSEEESNNLQSLPQVEQVLLKLLRQVDTGRRRGAMKEEIILHKLREMGFEINEIPQIVDRIDDAFMAEDDGEMIRWFYLIPLEERNKEFDSMILTNDE